MAYITELFAGAETDSASCCCCAQVFPKMELVERQDGESAKGGSHRLSCTSPEYMAAVCTFDTFQEMVQEKVIVVFSRTYCMVGSDLRRSILLVCRVE